MFTPSLVCIVGLASGWLVPDARAATFTVPTDGTVNEVVHQAGALDLVLIEPGIYPVTELNTPPSLTIMATGPGVVLQATSTLLLRVDDDLALDGLELDGVDSQIAFVTDDATLTLQNCTLRNGDAIQGAQVQLASGSALQATSTTFVDGHAVTSGGSIASNGGTVSCSSCLFQNNVVDGPTGDGGAVWLSGASATFEQGEFSMNASTENTGGAMYITANSSVEIIDSAFQDNTASIEGGAIEVWSQSLVEVEGTFFQSNSAGTGGAIAISSDDDTGSDVTLMDVVALENAASFDGGAVAVVGGGHDLVVLLSELHQNTATRGGALYTESITTIDSSGLDQNSATGSGGAIHVANNASLTLTDSALVANLASGDGGGVRIANGEATVDRCVFEGNDAGDEGGGMSTASGQPSDVFRSLFCRNDAESAGGGLSQRGGGSVHNAHFIGNTSNQVFGGGLEVTSAGVVRHSAFVSNTPDAVGCTIGGGCTVERSLFVDNTIALGGDSPYTGTEPNSVESLVYLDAIVDWTETATLEGIGFLADVGPDLPCDPAQLVPPYGFIDLDQATGTDLDGTPADHGTSGGPDADPVFWGDGDGDGVANAWDCEPNDDQISPLVTEIPGNGIDENCDGLDEVPADADTDTDTDADTDSDTDADTDSDTDADTDSDTDADSDADTDSDTDSDTDADTDSDTDADTDTDTDADSDVDTDPRCDPADPATDCDQDGQTPEGGDCDDADPTVFLGAEELPDDIDQNCDGRVGQVRGACGCAGTPASGSLGTIGLLAGIALSMRRRRRFVDSTPRPTRPRWTRPGFLL